jgi:hypothetical protein
VSAAKEDIIDETLKLFRAQVFFKNFEVRVRPPPTRRIAGPPELPSPRCTLRVDGTAGGVLSDTASSSVLLVCRSRHRLI